MEKALELQPNHSMALELREELKQKTALAKSQVREKERERKMERKVCVVEITEYLKVGEERKWGREML